MYNQHENPYINLQPPFICSYQQIMPHNIPIMFQFNPIINNGLNIPQLNSNTQIHYEFLKQLLSRLEQQCNGQIVNLSVYKYILSILNKQICLKVIFSVIQLLYQKGNHQSMPGFFHQQVVLYIEDHYPSHLNYEQQVFKIVKIDAKSAEILIHIFKCVGNIYLAKIVSLISSCTINDLNIYVENLLNSTILSTHHNEQLMSAVQWLLNQNIIHSDNQTWIQKYRKLMFLEVQRFVNGKQKFNVIQYKFYKLLSQKKLFDNSIYQYFQEQILKDYQLFQQTNDQEKKFQQFFKIKCNQIIFILMLQPFNKHKTYLLRFIQNLGNLLNIQDQKVKEMIKFALSQTNRKNTNCIQYLDDCFQQFLQRQII